MLVFIGMMCLGELSLAFLLVREMAYDLDHLPRRSSYAYVEHTAAAGAKCSCAPCDTDFR